MCVGAGGRWQGRGEKGRRVGSKLFRLISMHACLSLAAAFAMWALMWACTLPIWQFNQLNKAQRNACYSAGEWQRDGKKKKRRNRTKAETETETESETETAASL